MADQIDLSVGPLTFQAVAEGPADGVPVLLLHGFPESSWAWRFVQPALAAAGYRSVAPDLRGYSPGARPLDPQQYTISLLVDDVFGLADALGWERFHLVGHDWGGVAAWHAAGRDAARIRSLTVLSTPHPRAFAAAKSGATEEGDDQAAKSAYMDVFRQEGSEDVFLADDGEVFRAGLVGFGLDDASAAHYVGLRTTRDALTGPLNWYRAPPRLMPTRSGRWPRPRCTSGPMPTPSSVPAPPTPRAATCRASIASRSWRA